jgi:uncharacterized damage-inducible protein DinB
MKNIAKPTDYEYALYYQDFINLVQKDVQVLKQLKENAKALELLLKNLPEEILLYSYEKGKWNIKDILQHLIDVERVFLQRALRFARADKNPQAFFDENKFAEEANASKINIKKLLKDYKNVRNATLSFFDNLPATSHKKTGIASNSAMSVRACAWIICGHELHHIKVLKQKYLVKIEPNK